MKTNHILTIATLLFVMAFAAGCGSKYARSTPEELGNSVFEIFKNKDRDGLKSIAPTKKDLLNTLEKSEMPEDKRSEAIDKFEEEWPEIEKRMNERVFEEFDKAVKELEEEVTELKTAELVKVEVGEVKERDGFKQADIDVIFKLGDEEFKCEIPRAGEMKSGWVMSPRGFRIKEN